MIYGPVYAARAVYSAAGEHTVALGLLINVWMRRLFLSSYAKALCSS